MTDCRLLVLHPGNQDQLPPSAKALFDAIPSATGLSLALLPVHSSLKPHTALEQLDSKICKEQGPSSLATPTAPLTIPNLPAKPSPTTTTPTACSNLAFHPPLPTRHRDHQNHPTCLATSPSRAVSLTLRLSRTSHHRQPPPPPTIVCTINAPPSRRRLTQGRRTAHMSQTEIRKKRY